MFFQLVSLYVNVLLPLGANTKLVLMVFPVINQVMVNHLILCVYYSNYQKAIFGNNVGDEQERNNI